MEKNIRLHFVATQEQKDSYKQAADEDSRSLSSFIRLHCDLGAAQAEKRRAASRR